MAVNVGDLNATLSLTDSLSPGMLAAADAVASGSEAINAGLAGVSAAAAAASASITGLAETAVDAGAATDVLAGGADTLAAATENAFAGVTTLDESLAALGPATDDAFAGMVELATSADAAAASLTAVGAAGTEAAEGGLEASVASIGEFVASVGSMLGPLAVLVGGAGLLEAGSSALELGQDLSDLSLATGISTTGLQQLAYASAQFGIPIDELAQTIDRMQKNIATGSPTVVAAFQDMGLSVDTLKTTAPQQLLEAVSSALAAIPDPGRAAADAMNALGRVPPQMIALLRSNIVGLEGDAKTMSDEQVHDLDVAGKAWDAFEQDVKIATSGVVASTISTMEALATGWEHLRDSLGGPINVDPINGLAAAADHATSSVKSMSDETSATLAALQQQNAQMVSDQKTVQGWSTAQTAATAAAKSFIAAGLLPQVQAAMAVNTAQKDVEKTLNLQPGEYDLLKKAIDQSTQEQTKNTTAIKAWSDQFTHSAETVKALALTEWFNQVGGATHATATATAFYTTNLLQLQEKGADLNATQEQWLITQGVAGTLLISNTAHIKDMIPWLQKNTDSLTYLGKAATEAFDAPLVPIENFLNGLTKMDADLDKVEGDQLTKVIPGLAAGAKAWDAWGVAAQKAETVALATGTNWDKDFKSVESDLQGLASATTGTFSTVVSDVDKGVKAVQGFGDDIGEIANGTNVIGGLIGIGTTIVGLASDLWNSVFGLNATQTALQNLGVTVKNQLFGDPWFASQTEELKELQGQATLTAPTLTDLFAGVTAGGTQATAAMKTLASLLPEIEKNATLATSTATELLTTIKGGGAEASDALTDVNTMVTDFQSQAATTSGVWSTAFQSLIQQSQALGQNVASITSALQTQVTNASDGIAQALKVTSDAYTAAAADQAALADSSTSATDVAKDTADLVTQQGIIQATQIQTQQQASAVADSIVGIVDANMKAGQSFVQAFTGSEPAIQGLQAQLQATGFSGGQAFDFLNQEVTIATGAISGPALKATEGYTQAVVGMANAGMLTQTSFAGLEDSIASTDSTLQAQGASGQAALASLQPDLQAAWQLEQQFGYTADSATQSLIDQGVQSGIVGEKQESSTQQMVDSLNGVKTDLDEIVDKMMGLGSAATTAAGQINSAFGSIQNPSVSLDVNTQQAQSALAAAGSDSTAPGAPVTESTWGGPVGDAPLTAVETPGAVWLKPGDIYGMPDLSGVGGTESGAAIAGFGSTSASGSDSSGGPVAMTFQISISGIDGPSLERSATTLATIVVQKIQSSGVLQTALVNRGVLPVLRQKGLTASGANG